MLPDRGLFAQRREDLVGETAAVQLGSSEIDFVQVQGHLVLLS
jgi:hypothetical protein